MHEISYAYVGDGRNNMANSLLLVGAKLGMDVRIGAPKHLQPAEDHVTLCEGFAEESGARITITDDPAKAVKGVDFIHTDVWVSMGEPIEVWGERIDAADALPGERETHEGVGQSAREVHALPAGLPQSETKVGKQIAEQYPALENGIEVTEDVFESPANIAFDQAENRMHTIKAVLVSALGCRISGPVRPASS